MALRLWLTYPWFNLFFVFPANFCIQSLDHCTCVNHFWQLEHKSLWKWTLQNLFYFIIIIAIKIHFVGRGTGLEVSCTKYIVKTFFSWSKLFQFLSACVIVINWVENLKIFCITKNNSVNLPHSLILLKIISLSNSGKKAKWENNTGSFQIAGSTKEQQCKTLNQGNCHHKQQNESQKNTVLINK